MKLDARALAEQMNTILVPTRFSALRGEDAGPLPAGGDTPRLFELRRWTCRPAAADEVLAWLADGGADLASRHIPDVLGWFTADTGVDHRLFRLAAFADADSRDRARDAARSDPEVVKCRPWLNAAIVEE